MAQFEGTIKEFTKFIGAYARIKVMHIASKYKMHIGKCEECGLKTKSLDAAHITGKERPILISNILSQFIEDDIIKMDLNEFEERFIEAHLPIESTIRILCKPCHRKYDNSKKIHEIVPGEIGVENAVHLENYEVKEGEIIKNLINQKAMNKSKALKLSYSKGLTGFTKANTIFSNIISIQQGWWLQPHNDNFKNLLHIILNDDKASKLYIFRIPANTIANPASHFKQRNDSYRTNCSDIYLPTSGTRFKEKNGFDFTKFLVDTITY